MGEYVGMAITLGTIGAYLYLNWFVATRSASFISGLFAKPDDDEVVSHDIDEKTGLPSIPVTRGGRRFSYWFFLVVVPIVVYINYKYVAEIWNLLDTVANALAGFALKFMSPE